MLVLIQAIFLTFKNITIVLLNVYDTTIIIIFMLDLCAAFIALWDICYLALAKKLQESSTDIYWFQETMSVPGNYAKCYNITIEIIFLGLYYVCMTLMHRLIMGLFLFISIWH